ncbi:hypothetical protein [Streptomyces sp. NPDC059788]|uniref:hypothetical protein n=1 Tax=Streptomyces sp. NPDC059788 TaxID=3346948 RepID=UPI003666914E
MQDEGMSDVPTAEPAAQSAYDLDLEMSLLLFSSAPDRWVTAVHEAARILINRPWVRGGRAGDELCTLALLLFARTYTGERQPHDVPTAELHDALAGPADREPQIIDEIELALNATGQSYDPTSLYAPPLWRIFNTIRSQYGGRLGSSLADDIEPPAPSPSPMRGAVQRLTELLTGCSDQERRQATAPEVQAGSLTIEADRIRIVTANSLVRLCCPDDHPARVVRADGPSAIRECAQGHVSEHWQLDPAHLRVAAARATGVRPSSQGVHQAQDLMIVAADMPRHSDPNEINAFLRQPEYPIVGRDDIIEQVRRKVDGAD